MGPFERWLVWRVGVPRLCWVLLVLGLVLGSRFPGASSRLLPLLMVLIVLLVLTLVSSRRVEGPGSGAGDSIRAENGVRGGLPRIALVGALILTAGAVLGTGDVLGTLTAIDADSPEARSGGFWGAMRARSSGYLGLGLGGPQAGLLRGVVLGERDGVPRELIDAFRASGLAHILSVSGLHVAGLAGGVIAIAGVLRLPRRPALLLAGLCAAVFVPLTGARVPVIRAFVMLLAVLSAELSGRRRDSWLVLVQAATVVLVWDPLAYTAVGFQLSFAAVAGILAWGSRLQRALGFLPELLAQGMAISLAATLGTLPVSLLVFGSASIVGVLANVFAVPVLPVVMGLGMGSLLSGFLGEALPVVFNRLAAVLLAYVTEIAMVFSRAPLLEFRMVAPLLGLLVGGAAAYVLLLLKRREDARAGRGFALLPILAAGGLLGLALWTAASFVHREAVLAWGRESWPERPELRVLDAGEGAAVLVRTPGGKTALIDGGPAEMDLGGQLRALGVRRLDLVVITHPHLDHFGGLLEALAELEVETFIDRVRLTEADSMAPGGGVDGIVDGVRVKGVDQAWAKEPSRDSMAYYALLEALDEQGSRRLSGEEALKLRLDGLEFEFLARRPPVLVDRGAGKELDGDRVNDASLVTVVRCDGVAILVPGDAEAPVLRALGIPVVALVVPHHGSKEAVDAALLMRLAPSIAVIPVGPNTYGHPAPEVIADLAASGVSTFRSDAHGWVALEFGQGRLAVRTQHGSGAVSARPSTDMVWWMREQRQRGIVSARRQGRKEQRDRRGRGQAAFVPGVSHPWGRRTQGRTRAPPPACPHSRGVGHRTEHRRVPRGRPSGTRSGGCRQHSGLLGGNPVGPGA